MRMGEGMDESAVALRLDTPWCIPANHQANCAPAPPQACLNAQFNEVVFRFVVNYG